MSDFLSNFSGSNYDKTRQEKLFDKEQKKKTKTKTPSKKDPLDNGKKGSEIQKEVFQKKMGTAKRKRTGIQAGDVPYGPVNVISDEEFAEKRRKRKTVSEKMDSVKPQSRLDNHEPVNPKKINRQKKESKDESLQKAEPVPTSEEKGIEPAFFGTEQVEEPVVSHYEEEVIETDPTYKKKKQKKYIMIGLVALIVAGVLFFTYYQLTHVAVPDFKGKELADARSWTTENDVKLQVKQKYDFKAEANVILKQSMTKKKIKKGTELLVEASLGPDPEEVIPLPDFKAMKLPAAKSWIADHKADNIALIEEYSDTVAAGDFIKFEMTTKEATAETYKRKEKGKAYYSKGKEVYEKDISVPDFVGKMKEEPTEWAKKNDIQLKLEEEDSDTIENGKIIAQSIPKDQKIAKKETITLKVSSGKSVSVPDFSQYTLQEAEAKSEGLQIQVKQVFNDTIPYGRFISQNVTAGTKYKEKAEKPSIQVTYSAGRPFLKDLRETTLEGDLQKIFYDEYQSKGANISYQVYYVDSSVIKGTVVQMSKYNEFVPVDYVVQIGISRGNIQPEPEKQTKESE